MIDFENYTKTFNLNLHFQISDKDQSLLEERIKRAAKKSSGSRLSTNRNSMIVPPTQLTPNTDTSPVLSREPSDLDCKEDEEAPPEITPPSPARLDMYIFPLMYVFNYILLLFF